LEQFVRCRLKLFSGDFSTGVGLQLGVELIVLFHSGFARGAGLDSGTEFLKVQADAVEGDTAPAVRTFNSRQR
jgi:hypothetical protein